MGGSYLATNLDLSMHVKARLTRNTLHVTALHERKEHLRGSLVLEDQEDGTMFAVEAGPRDPTWTLGRKELSYK